VFEVGNVDRALAQMFCARLRAQLAGRTPLTVGPACPSTVARGIPSAVDG
jgi:hypothetical protein